MPHNHSKLDTVLKYRSRLVEEAQIELAKLKQRLSIEETRLLQLDQKRKEVIHNMAERQNTGIKQEEISLSHQFIKLQGDRIHNQTRSVKMLSEEYESQRAHLESLLQEKKVVENIRNKRQKVKADWLKKSENDILDEVSGRREGSI
ncbi:MAG: flagellar export protein FliJ [Nitrospiria bacterium]